MSPSPDTHQAQPRLKRILLVDDEPMLTSLLRLNLEDTGQYEVLEVNNSLQALGTIETFMPDLILLDVMMPDLDGADVIYRLKNDQRLKHIVVVFHTATVRRMELDSRGSTISGYPFLAKPASTATIVECIERELAKAASSSTSA